MGLELIHQLKKEKGFTTEQLSTLSGVPIGTLNKILNGSTKDPKFDTLRALCKVLNCSLDAFDDNEKSCDSSSSKDREILARYHVSPYKQAIDQLLYVDQPQEPRYSIMLYDMMHLPDNGYFFDNDPYEIIEVSNVPAGTHFAVRLAGCEMEPHYFHRQIIYFQRLNHLSSGDYGLFLLDNKLLFRIFRLKREKIILEAVNPAVSSMPVNEEKSFKIIGKALTDPLS